MHGDDVASAGVEVSTHIVSKTTELIMEMIKVAIEKERNAKGFKPKSAVLSGGEVTYQKLKEGGKVIMLPSFAKEDYKAFLKKAKAMDIPVAAIQESGKENTLSLFFNVKDKEAVNSIVQDIVREKLKQPEQTERMITIEKEQVEGFQMYCSEHDIPVNFLETQGGVKCIFGADYEKQMEVAVENYRNIQSELSQIGTEVEKNVKGKFQIKLTDNEQGKSLTMNFCTKAKLERVLQERMGYSEVKAVEVANSLTNKLTDSQRQYYLSDSRQLGEMDFYETDIKFDDDNLLLENYSFVKLKANGDDEPKLTVTDKSGNFVVLSAKNLDRAEVEERLRAYLKINDSETIKAILDKSERLRFAEQPKQVQFKEFQIERDTQSSFTVRGGSTVVRLDLNNKESAKKQLMDAFGMSAGKAEKIIGKAQKQKVADNVDGNYSTTAVIKMVNVLMKNTQKEGGGGGDQFWDDSTKALLAALCFYLVECESKEMQNFSEVMKLLKKAEVKEGKDEFQSDLDLIFDALEHPEKYRTKRLEDSDPDNAYLIKDIETVKFSGDTEVESGENIYSEPVEDAENESGGAAANNQKQSTRNTSSEEVPTQDDEIDRSVTVEEIHYYENTKGAKVMKNKEKSYAEELRRCRENIAKTKKLIEYHKDMLKKMERKEAEVQAKLDGVKLLDLRELISKGGYDIDTLREAMKAGDFSEISVQSAAEKTA